MLHGFVINILSNRLFISFISSLGASVYVSKYYELIADFSSILPFWKITATFFSVGLFLAGFHFVLNKLFLKLGLLIFNITLSLLTLSSILFPIMKADFPDSLEMTEFYPWFVIPLHFILPLFWLALSPLIKKNEN